MTLPANPFFDTCRVCRTVHVYMTGYGIGVVSCDCGVELSGLLCSWEALQQAAVRWNEKLAVATTEG